MNRSPDGKSRKLSVSTSAARIMTQVRRIEFQARGRISDLLSGGHLSAFKGTGMQFREVRAYNDGDDPRHIDWNVTARSQDPWVKVFEEERELTAVFLLDLSASLFCGSQGATGREAAALFSATLAMSCFGAQERLALLACSDRVEKWLPPARGPQALSRLLREMVSCEPNGQRTDLRAACDALSRRLPRRSVIFVVSDFRDDPDQYGPALRRLGIHHDLNLVHIELAGLDPLPKAGLVCFLDAETGEEFELDTSDVRLREFLSKTRQTEIDQLHHHAKRARATCLALKTGADPVQSVRQLVRKRQTSGVTR